MSEGGAAARDPRLPHLPAPHTGQRARPAGWARGVWGRGPQGETPTVVSGSQGLVTSRPRAPRLLGGGGSSALGSHGDTRTPSWMTGETRLEPRTGRPSRGSPSSSEATRSSPQPCAVGGREWWGRGRGRANTQARALQTRRFLHGASNPGWGRPASAPPAGQSSAMSESERGLTGV